MNQVNGSFGLNWPRIHIEYVRVCKTSELLSVGLLRILKPKLNLQKPAARGLPPQRVY